MNIVESTKRYEKWLKKQLPAAVVDTEAMKKDLDEKHDKMAADPFQFLRATYWRWAQIARETCPNLSWGHRSPRSATSISRTMGCGATKMAA